MERETAEAEAGVVDEIRLASGLGLSDAVARVRLGRASGDRAGHVRARLASGSCSWAMARVWHEATTDLPAEVADGIAAVVLAPTRDGAALSMGLFRQRLGRQIAKHGLASRLPGFVGVVGVAGLGGSLPWWFAAGVDSGDRSADGVDGVARSEP